MNLRRLPQLAFPEDLLPDIREGSLAPLALVDLECQGSLAELDPVLVTAVEMPPVVAEHPISIAPWPMSTSAEKVAVVTGGNDLSVFPTAIPAIPEDSLAASRVGRLRRRQRSKQLAERRSESLSKKSLFSQTAKLLSRC